MLQELHHIIQDGPRITEYYCRSDGTQITILEIIAPLDEDIIIPEFIDELPVTAISGACTGNVNIHSIRFPSTLRKISDGSFMHCKRLISVDLAACEELSTIPKKAFYGCPVLYRVDLCGSIDTIERYAFGNCPSLSVITYPRTQAVWNRINIQEGNEDMANAELKLVVPTISLNEADIEIRVNKKFKLVPTVSHENCEVVWESSNESVATVEDGVVTALASGLVTIRATICYDSEYATASCTVLCYNYHTCTFVNWDGSLLQQTQVRYMHQVEPPKSPYKRADVYNRYVFIGWDNDLVCMGDTVYTAQYKAEPILYTVQFRQPDGKIIREDQYKYGDRVFEPVMQNSADNTYRRIFVGWDKEVTSVTQDEVYIAVWDVRYIDYTITFKDYDGSIIDSTAYHYGDPVKLPATPTRESDNTYQYTFKSWTDGDSTTVPRVTQSRTYTARYTKEYLHKGDKITVGSAAGVPGEPVSVHVSVTGNVGIAGGLHTIEFNSKLFTFKEAKLCEAYSECRIVVNKDHADSGSINVLWYSDVDIKEDSEIYELVFDTVKEAANGTYDVKITFTDEGNVNTSGKNVHFDAVDGAITIGDQVPGDSDEDGTYTEDDLTALATLVADTDKKLTADEIVNSDLNTDKAVNLHDVILLAQKVPRQEDDQGSDEE